MRVTGTRISLKLADSFRTAAASRTDKETLWIKLDHDGVQGWGEAVPMDTYGQTLASAEQTLADIAARLDAFPVPIDPLQVERITIDLVRQYPDQLATVAGIDAALHDWIGKRFDLPTLRWLGLTPEPVPETSFTIGIDAPDEIERRVRAAARYPVLKIKLGGPQDEESLELIRRTAPDKRIRVDANMAWCVNEAMEKLPWLAAKRIEFVEQPLPREDLAGLRQLREAGVCPIMADESCVGPEDVVALQGCVDGINIKLSKCGGIRQAIKMIHLARGFGMKIMLGCMIESSLGIAAAAQLSPLVDYLDLDGHLLLSQDPFYGLGGEHGHLRVGQEPGLGVHPVKHLHATMQAG